MFLVRISLKKRRAGGRAGGFSCYLLLPIACFLYTLLPSPRDTLELLGQILIKRNSRYGLDTGLFSFDTHKGLTVKKYIILVCTQQQWALQVTPVGFSLTETLAIKKKKNYKKREAALKNEAGRDEKRVFLLGLKSLKRPITEHHDFVQLKCMVPMQSLENFIVKLT